MSYEKQTWVTGEVITAEKLNHIEGGVEANDNFKVFTFNVTESSGTYTVTLEDAQIEDIFACARDGLIPFARILKYSDGAVEDYSYIPLYVTSYGVFFGTLAICNGSQLVMTTVNCIGGSIGYLYNSIELNS